MPRLKIACTDMQDNALQLDLCPDEAHRFGEWCQEVESRAAIDPNAAQVLVAKGLKYRDWFDMFNLGMTPREAMIKECAQ